MINLAPDARELRKTGLRKRMTPIFYEAKLTILSILLLKVILRIPNSDFIQNVFELGNHCCNPEKDLKIHQKVFHVVYIKFRNKIL